MDEKLFHLIQNLNTELNVPAGSKTNKTIFENENLKAVLFGFAAGQGLSEHKAPMPVILQVIRGEATISLDDAESDAVAGTWVHLEQGFRHSILAKTETIMLLLLLKSAQKSQPESSVKATSEA